MKSIIRIAVAYLALGVSCAQAGKTTIPIIHLLLMGEPLAINLCQAGLLADLNGTSSGSFRINPQFTELGNQTFFLVDHPDHGAELWVTNGTPLGTHLFLDIHPGAADGISGSSALESRLIERVGNKLYFLANDGVHGETLWITDGSIAGTHMVKDIDNSSSSSGINNITVYNGKVYFLANMGIASGEGLWASDGTANGTEQIKSMFVSNTANAMAVVNNKLVFRAQGLGDDNNKGKEIWVSDGTRAGTQLLKDINPTGSSLPDNFVVLDDQVFFIADNGESGAEIWVTDGTPAGTQLLKDIYPGTTDGVTELQLSSGYKRNPGFNGKLYFRAERPGIGRELWVTDGTPGGTLLARDIYAGVLDGLPVFQSAEVFNHHFYFMADDGVHGLELWQVDTNGVVMLAKDIDPGVIGTLPEHFASNDDYLFFSSNISFNVGTEPTIMNKAGHIRQVDTRFGSASADPEYFHIREDQSAVFTQIDATGVGLYQIQCPAPSGEG